MDYPRLRSPLICLIMAALFLSITLKARELPDWIRMFSAFMALVLGVTGVITLIDWLMYNSAQRIKEVNAARTYGAVVLAQSLKGLTTGQTEAIMAGERVAMEMIPGDNDPVLFVRGLVRNIPWTFVQEYLERSIETEPFLWPVREAGNEDFASDLTNLIVSRGWATKSVGPYSAKLTKPLVWVARRFWVDLEEVGDEKTD